MTNWYDHLEDYILGKLPPPLREQMEAALRHDPTLTEKVRRHRLEWEAGELLAEKLLRAQVQEQFMRRRAWHFRIWKWALPAALILLAGTALLIYRLQPTPKPKAEPPAAASPADSLPLKPGSKPGDPTPPPVAEQKRQPDARAGALAAYRMPESLSGLRALAAGGDSLSLAQEAFFSTNYRLALGYLSPLPTEYYNEALSLRAHAHFLAGNFELASRDFSKLLDGGVYVREAQWYGLLADLAMKGFKAENWQKRLNAIRSEEVHPYRNEAAGLWKKWKRE